MGYYVEEILNIFFKIFFWNIFLYKINFINIRLSKNEKEELNMV